MHDVAWRGMWICVRSKDVQKQLARTSLNLLFRDVLVAVAVVVCVRSLLFLRWFYKAAFTRQTKVRKFKLVCVNGIKAVGKQVGKQLARNRTSLCSRQLLFHFFRFSKLESDM